MDWFKAKSTGNHRFSHEIWGFPVNFPIIQFYEQINPGDEGKPRLFSGAAGAAGDAAWR
jgi:hypothetical protein